jgi:hypothetical protein
MESQVFHCGRSNLCRCKHIVALLIKAENRRCDLITRYDRRVESHSGSALRNDFIGL